MGFIFSLDTSLYLKNKSTFSQFNLINLILLNELNSIKTEQNEVNVSKLFSSEFKHKTNFFRMFKKFALCKRRLFIPRRIDSYQSNNFSHLILLLVLESL